MSSGKMSYCEDCGTKKEKSICPNCHEELYIFETQYEDIACVSEEFRSKIEEQRKIIEGEVNG